MSELLLTKKQNAQLLENQQILIVRFDDHFQAPSHQSRIIHILIAQEANAKINEQYRQSQGT